MTYRAVPTCLPAKAGATCARRCGSARSTTASLPSLAKAVAAKPRCEDLQERIREERKPVVLIQPYARARARASGNPMQPTHIEAAMFRALGAGVPRKSNPDDRSAQINALLAGSLTAGYTHLLLIEEARRWTH